MIQSICILFVFTIFRYAHGAGGILDVSVDTMRNDELIQRAFQFAVKEYNMQINSAYVMVPYQIHSIKKQVVAGILFKFETTLVGSNCRDKSMDELTLLKCGLNDLIQPIKMVMTIVLQPWMKPKGYSFKTENVAPDYDLNLHDQLFVVGAGDGNMATGVNFDKFKKLYGKSYETAEEESHRHQVYHSNFKKGLLLRMLEQGSAVYGETKFYDMTAEEFSKDYLSPAWDLSKMPSKVAPIPRMMAPKSVDWRAKGAVTPVKNQKSCGSCWAFSTTGNVEGQWFVKTKKLVSLSEQQLVDCDKVDQGCNGGLPSQAYKAIEQMGGLETESQYPYDAHRETCQLDKSDIRVFINDSVTISSVEDQMAVWCALNGPISIGINAFAMQFYRGGVSHPYSIFCNKNHLDHGVLIVGYSQTTAGEPYWIVKNSWGPDWGEKGYYLVYKGSGVCGLNKMPTSAVVKLH